MYSVHSGSGHDFRMQVESLIYIFSAHFGQIWKISVPIMKRISQIFRNTPYFLSLCHFEGSYSQSKITFRATSFALGDCIHHSFPPHTFGVTTSFPIHLSYSLVSFQGPDGPCIIAIITSPSASGL